MRASHFAFFSLSALLFAARVVLTMFWCTSTPAMRSMPMPGGWTMSMAWMRMPGQTWAAAAVSFVGMWIVMMVAMMLPSLIHMLWRYREAVGMAADKRLGRLTVIVAVGYLIVWTAIGIAIYPLGIALATVEMQQPAVARVVPMAAAAIVAIAGAIQFTAWKARQLDCCQARRTLTADAGGAWRHGLRCGLHCVRCCGNLMAILLVAGVMDLRAMAVITLAVTAERLAPRAVRVAQVIGTIAVGAGLLMIARAAR